MCGAFSVGLKPRPNFLRTKISQEKYYKKSYLELWVSADIQEKKLSLWDHHAVCVLPFWRLNQLTEFQGTH
jgi:hypothetical protein